MSTETQKIDLDAVMKDAEAKLSASFRDSHAESAHALSLVRAAVAELIEDRRVLADALRWVAEFSYAGGKRFADVEPIKAALDRLEVRRG